MLKLDIPFNSNLLGVKTATLLIDKIRAQHPALQIAEATHYIKNVQQMPTRYEPWQSVVEIGSKSDPSYSRLFQYSRWPISRYITNPLFTEAEVLLVKEMDEVELLAFLKTKLSLNLNSVDFIVEPDGIEYTGGYKQPNWRIVAAPDSPFWYSDKVIWLHDGTPAVEPPPPPPPPPPPEDDIIYQRLFPIVKIDTYLGAGGDYVDVYLKENEGKTVFLNCPPDPTYAQDIWFVATPDMEVGHEVHMYNTMPLPYTILMETESIQTVIGDTTNLKNLYIKVNGVDPIEFDLLSGGFMRAILMEVKSEEVGDGVTAVYQTWHLIGAAIAKSATMGPQ